MSVDASAHQTTGAQAFKNGDFAAAVTAYSQAIALEPHNPVHYANRSAAHVRLGDFAAAVADADAAIQADPNHVKGYNLKGTALIAMKEYQRAVEVYQQGLAIAPHEESLRMGHEAAKYALREHSSVHRAVRRSRAARKSSEVLLHKARHAPTASTFVAETRRQIKVEMASLQAQLDLLAELEEMTDEAKVKMLFSLIDTKMDGFVDASELAQALRRRPNRKSVPLSETIDQAIRTVAAFDQNGDTKLDLVEFSACMEATRQEMHVSLAEFCEFMCLQLTLGDDDDGPYESSTCATDRSANTDSPSHSQSYSHSPPSPTTVDEQVREQEQYMDILRDPRMQQLFHLFDTDGSMELSFKQVAAGLYHLTHDMTESTRTTMILLFTLDKDDRRTLDYEQFGRLVMAVVATSTASFDAVVDNLIFALTANEPIPESELQALYIADSMYNGVVDLQHKEHEISGLMDKLVYGRIQLLFDAWDTDKDGQISKTDLLVGLQHYHEASHEDGNPEEEAASMIEFDHDGDHLLDRLDFARALGTFAKNTGRDLHDMIDFMCVTATLGEQETQSYKRAFRHSVSMDAAAMALKEINNVEKNVHVDEGGDSSPTIPTAREAASS